MGSPARAVSYDISKNLGLTENCGEVIKAEESKPYDERSYGLCFGFIQGVKISYDIQRIATRGRGGKICFPREITWLELIKIYLRWVDINPKHLNALAWSGVINAFSATFPCDPPPEKPVKR